MNAQRQVMIAVLILGLAAGGCTARSHGTAAQGTVTGTIRLVGGPAPGVNEPAPGTVSVFTSAGLTGKAVATAQAGTSGSFTVNLSPGTYYLAATSPRYGIDPAPSTPPCRALGPTVVTTGGTVQADVICTMK